MKKNVYLLLLLVCFGCVSVKVPKYLKEESPYTKTFYATFDDTFSAVQKSLNNLGWHITDTANPSVFEQDKTNLSPGAKQVLIFTEVRQTPFIVSSRYMNLNVYIRSADNNATDVEVRYISVVPMFFKNMKSYKNDEVVNKLLAQISGYLEK